MSITILPSTISGQLTAPPSKSMMQRVIAISLLTNGNTVIKDPIFCDDSSASLNLISELGVEIIRSEAHVELRNLNILKNNTFKKKTLICGESGLCIRMFSPILSLFNREFVLKAEGSLKKRTLKFIEKPLSELGGRCKTENGFPPVNITGPIKGGNIKIDGSITSQFLTGLLLSLPVCEKDSRISVKDLKSKPYVEMTLSLLKNSGIIIEASEQLDSFIIPGKQIYMPMTYKIEGDWSAASFLLTLAAINGEVKVKGLNIDSKQADIRILDVLKLVGADLIIEKDIITVKKKELKPFIFDINDSPDLFPALAVLGTFCNGKSVIKGTERLKHKESSRDDVIKKEFSKLGIRIDLYKEHIEIFGNNTIKDIRAESVSAHNDHRVAMALSILGINSKNGIIIEGWKSVSKSYPEFFADLKMLGGNII